MSLKCPMPSVNSSNPFHQAKFFTTANRRSQMIDDCLEIAFAGRSNAGKSSTINTITGRRSLAYVSKTPGRTQYINYFELPSNGEKRRFIVDLPGYGYAKVPREISNHWKELLSKYLRRENLIGLVLICDSRRGLGKLDFQLLDFFISYKDRPIHIMLTKSDKLNREERSKVLKDSLEKTKSISDQISIECFSNFHKINKAEIHQIASEWFKKGDR